MENGLPSKFLINLSDKQVDNLYNKYLNEQPQPVVKTKTVKQIEIPSGSETSVGGVSVSNKAGKTVVTTTAEGEMKEDATIEKDPFQTTSTQDDRQVGPSDYGNNPTKDKEMDADDADGMDILEAKKKKSKYNPWAVCTSQMGKEFGTTERSDWSKPQMAKYERCVKDVKKSIKEGNDPYESLLESHIIKLVNKHVNENMQLVSFKKLDKPIGKMYSSKKSNPMEAAEPVVKPRTAPPKTKPGVKPSTPNPYQPPKETPKEKPRAQDYKSMFISALNQLLGK